MAGYVGFSKSENAVHAENMDRFPATAIAQKLGKGCTAAGVKEVLNPCEWHHTSKMYNATDYYDLEEAIEKIEEIREASKPVKSTEKVYTNIKVEWLEWGGSRKHPQATTCIAENATVIDKGGAFLEISFVNKYGKTQTIKKGKETKGLKLNGADGYDWFLIKLNKIYLDNHC